jgi:hypothetical protein
MKGRGKGWSGSGAAIFLALLITAGAMTISAPAGAIEVRVQSFGNGQAGAVVAFPSAGSDSSLNISVQTGMRASSVFFNLSGEPFTAGGKDYPYSPSLDLGADGDVEWRFNGTGYGALGHQYLFSDGAASFRAVFPAAGINDSMALRLPAGATVADASFDIGPSGFGGTSVNVSVDIGADDIVDWSNTTLNGQVSVSGLGSLIDAYLGAAAPTGGDAWGVQYVDVPVRLRCGSAATVTVTNLSVRYDVTLSTPNLALRLNALIPSAPGASNVSVPVKLSSDSAGRLRIRDLGITARSPLHAPDILDPSPAVSPELYIDENRSAAFSVGVQDIYGDPVTLQWSVDLLPVPGENGTSFDFTTNYTSSGRHSVMVTANNGLSESSLTWWVNVRDINLPPVIRRFTPLTASVAEGSTLTFSVDAYDPDGGALGYTWTLDGREQVDKTASFAYIPPFGAAGYHSVGVAVGDAGGGTTALNWTVLVLKTNLPPEIRSFGPPADPAMDEGQTLAFSVSASDPNGDPLTYEWVLDGYSAGFGDQFNYSPDFTQAGNWTLQVIVRDGGFTVGHSWNITVRDVNHAPVAVIDRPLDGDVFLDSDRIALSARNSSDPDRDPLALRWYDGDILLAENSTANATLARGVHRLRLVAEDGKGGRGESSVNITIRTVRILTNVSLSSKSPREGDRLRIKVSVSNQGDTTERDIPVELQVDGVPGTPRTIARILPGENATEFFFWTAEAGRHDLAVGVGNESSVMYLSVASGIPVMVYWIVLSLVAAFGIVALLAVFFSFQWDRAIKEGILDERKRRGKKKDLEKSRRQDEWKPLGFLNIRLGFSPYKEKPLVIKTTMPEDQSPQDAIRESLTPVHKRYLTHFSAPSKSGHITQTGGRAPVTAGVFASRPAAKPEAPAAGNVEIPLAHPAPPGSEAAPPDKLAPAVASAPAPPAARPPDPAAEQLRKPKKRIEALEDRIHGLEQKGADIAGPRRFVSLAKSFWKGGNIAKAEQYLEKAESRLEGLEKEAGPQTAGLACKKCGAPVDPAWIVCPECEAKLK